ncbi:MAG TPA: HRDC domain-containing protein [Leptospiraceae bacterium]|nr:HRDC domain-containing protein [Leptospiraceae bacterium]
MVFQNAVLQEIAKQKPTTMSELMSVRGFGSSRAEKFGLEILNIIQEDRF